MYTTVSATNLIFVLTFGDVFAADLDPRGQQTLEKVGTVKTKQVRDALRFCVNTYVDLYCFPHCLTSQFRLLTTIRTTSHSLVSKGKGRILIGL